MTKYIIGTTIKLSKVAATIPPNTVVPRICRDAEPAPEAINNGITPRINESAVINTARNRSFTDSTAESKILIPLLR